MHQETLSSVPVKFFLYHAFKHPKAQRTPSFTPFCSSITLRFGRCDAPEAPPPWQCAPIILCMMILACVTRLVHWKMGNQVISLTFSAYLRHSLTRRVYAETTVIPRHALVVRRPTSAPAHNSLASPEETLEGAPHLSSTFFSILPGCLADAPVIGPTLQECGHDIYWS